MLELEVHYDFTTRRWTPDDFEYATDIINATESVVKNLSIPVVTCRLLEVGDILYHDVPNGSFSHQRKWLEVKVLQTSKKLAYCDNGMKVYRKPRPRNNGGYRYFVKNGDALYPSKE